MDNMREVDNLIPLALAVILLTIVAGVGALVLSEFEVASGDDVAITNETFNATSDPFTLTVDNASQADFIAIKSVDGCFDEQAQTTDITCTILDERAGTVNVTDLAANPDDRTQSIDYTWSQDNDASGIVNTGITAVQDMADFFVVIVVIGIAAVIFLLLALVRRSGRTASR